MDEGTQGDDLDDVARVERLEVIVHGIVQGVFFRYNTQLQAERLGLTGTVENLTDGTVAVVGEGTREKLQELLVWLRRGSDAAVVERVDVSWETGSGSFDAFRILR